MCFLCSKSKKDFAFIRPCEITRHLLNLGLVNRQNFNRRV